MLDTTTFIGLDVHARSIKAVSLLDYQLYPNTSHIHPHMYG